MGEIGTLTGPASDYAPIWAAVERGATLEDIDRNWTFDRLCAYSEYQRMKADFKSAWAQFYRDQNRRQGDG
ncbi:hypothetical protein SAMN05720469_11562 [Fibrobacter intestinalis]|uniref:Uncharacterized protein n=1 Tax=Fibrobacter intestinalis TaxID=28122 RepID=A0A1M6UTZ2_9BACT|nr:hypothetical protein [Fibrobacter intestinalis]SHK72677.1 hypothetical protein SAMN05720469_11562 [Fibrobacter intestinalis]